MATSPAPTPVKLFVDSSVIYSAVTSSTGASRALLALAELGLVQLTLCPYILHEVEESLRWKQPLSLDPFRRVANATNWIVQPDPSVAEVARWLKVVADPKDAPIIAAAVIAKPHRLVTLDVKHLIEPTEVAGRSGLVICAPGQIMQEIRQYLAEGFGKVAPR